MANQDSSPIQVIKKKEEEAKDLIQKTHNNKAKELNLFKDKLDEKLVDYENALKIKGNEKLKTIKIEATEIAKTKIANANKDRKILIDEARSKKTDAIHFIQENFLSTIN